jgi:predicted nucleic acid-binding protein
VLFQRLDLSAAEQAIEYLHDWPGLRYGHQWLLRRAWAIRENVRGWDAMYVALAEMLRVTLITTDERLARAPGWHARLRSPQAAF